MTERINEIEARLSAIKQEIEAPDANLEALEEEVRTLNAEKAEIKAAEEKRKALLDDVANNHEVIETKENKEERKEMTDIEIRSSVEYVNAFANYIKSGDAKEVRALLTTNVNNGTVAVPTFVEDIIKTAWEKSDLMSLVRKTNMQGNVKVGFEISADGAVIHTEGGEAVTDENLVLGIVTLTPQSIKKMLHISDEVVDLGGEAFLRYVYEEISYQIVKKAADTLIGIIAALPTVSTATTPAAAQLEAAPAVGTIAQAIALVSDQATDLTIVMNKQTWGAFKAAAATANYAMDIFEGCRVVFNNSLPAYATAGDNAVYAIVGDFNYGAQANMPNGNGVTIKFDDKSEAEADLVKIVGRQYIALGAVAPNAFTNIIK